MGRGRRGRSPKGQNKKAADLGNGSNGGNVETPNTKGGTSASEDTIVSPSGQQFTKAPVHVPSTGPKSPERIVVGTPNGGNGHLASAERDSQGRELLKDAKWKTMKMDGSNDDDDGGDDDQDAPTTPWGKLFRTLYGNIPAEELLRVMFLSATLFTIVGGYWLLRSLKDPIISTIVGVEYIPKAKMLSLFVVLSVVFIYNKLVETVEKKHHLFYIVGGCYAAIFCLISLALGDPEMGIDNTEADPYRLLGWISYFAIESFGSVGVANFWAFTNSTLNLERAKSAFGLIVSGAQIGAILGPTLATFKAQTWGIPKLYFCGSLCMVAMLVMVHLYVARFGEGPSGDDGNGAGADGDRKAEEQKKKKKKKGSVMDGFWLVVKHPYVTGLFCTSCVFMIEVTILDYQMKVLAKADFDAQYPGDPVASSQAFASFMGKFGQWTNGLSFIFSLLGTSFIIRNIGLRSTLIAYPCCLMAAVSCVYMWPTLWTVFMAMMTLKGLSYALNNPCKELLYQATSKDVKYKAKSWIDMFGARGSKAFGSVITNAFTDSIEDLVTYGCSAAFSVAAFLLYVAMFMGRKFDEYQESGYVVGEEQDPAKAFSLVPDTPDDLDDEPDDGLEMGGVKNDDVSCGALEEGQGGEEDEECETVRV